MTQAPFPRNRAFLGSLAALTLTALALRLWKIGANSFWVDEVITSERAHMAFQELIRHVADRNHPPLYFLLVRWLSPLTGLDDAGLRIPSAIAGALCVPAAAWCIRCVLDGWDEERRRFAALSAAFILALSPYQIYYGQEARAYTMVVLFGFLHVAAWHVLLFRRASPSWKWSALFALTAVVGWHLHFAFAAFFGAGAVLTLAGFAFPSLRSGFMPGAFRRWAIPTGAALPACLPWTLFAPKQMGRMSAWQDGLADPLARLTDMAQNTLRPFGAMPSPYERAALFHHAWLALLAAGAGAAALWLFLRRKNGQEMPSAARWAAGWIGILLVGYAAAALFKNAVQMERHYALFTIPLVVVAGAGMANLPRQAGSVFLGAWTLWSVSFLVCVYYPLPQKTPWREISARISDRLKESGEGVHTTGIFVRPMLKHYPLSNSVRLLRAREIDSTERVFWWVHVREPQPPIPYNQPRMGNRVREIERIPMADFVDLVRYKRIEDAPAPHNLPAVPPHYPINPIRR